LPLQESTPDRPKSCSVRSDQIEKEFSIYLPSLARLRLSVALDEILLIFMNHMNRIETIKKLLKTLHLNIEERKIFENEAVTTSEVIQIAKEELMNSKFFPSSAPYEGCFIEKMPDLSFRLHCQRYGATNMQLAESNYEDFDNISDAVKELIKKEWKNDIDGINIS
jgi:hypothetical protein